MTTEQKYGAHNRQGIFLVLQMFLIKIGIAIQTLVLVFLCMHFSGETSVYMLIGTISMLIAHIAVLIYGYIGYKKSALFYHLTIGFFLLAILIQAVIPFRDTTQRILLVLLFGLMSIFPFKQDDYKFTNVLVLIAAILSLGFGIYSAITANIAVLGEGNRTYPAIIMYLSLFAPIVLVGLFGASYNAKVQKKQLEDAKEAEKAE